MRAAIIEALPFHPFLLSTGLIVITLALTPAALSQNIRKHTELVQHFNSELKNASAPARAEGGSGEVLQVDLEWDEARRA